MRHRFGMIRAVSFDVGGTLMAPWPSVGHVYARVAEAHIGFNADPERITRQFVNAWRKRGEFDYSREGWFDLVRHSFHGVADVTENLFTALYDSFSTHDAWRVFDDVIPCFDALQKGGIRLAVTSNWDARLKPTLKSVGLYDYFDVITVSGECGCNKPGRPIFDATAAGLGLSPGEILHIGDSHREDYVGASAAGFTALHLDRERETPGAVASLMGLISHLSGSAKESS